MKKKLFGISVIVLMFCVLAVSAHACSGKKGEKSSHFKLEDKFSYKAHLMLENQEEIGLTEDQIESIRALKLETKKSLIKQNAEIELLSVDMKAELYKDVIDVKALKKIVDKKYDFKKAKMNMVIDAYAKLKGVLDEGQRHFLKELWKEKKAAKGTYGEKPTCPMMK